MKQILDKCAEYWPVPLVIMVAVGMIGGLALMTRQPPNGAEVQESQPAQAELESTPKVEQRKCRHLEDEERIAQITTFEVRSNANTFALGIVGVGFALDKFETCEAAFRKRDELVAMFAERARNHDCSSHAETNKAPDTYRAWAIVPDKDCK